MQKRPQLSTRRHIAFPGIFDPFAFLSAATFRRFFVMPTPTELTEKAGFLHLFFEQAEGKLHVVMFHLDVHGITNDAAAVDVLRAASPG